MAVNLPEPEGEATRAREVYVAIYPKQPCYIAAIYATFCLSSKSMSLKNVARS